MAPRNILALLECGCITGVLWSFFQMLFVVTGINSGLMAVGDMKVISGEWYFVLDVLTGLWTIGIFLLMRSYFQSFPSAVGGTVIAWWVIQSLINIKSGGFDFTIAQASAFSIVSFLSMSFSVLTGTWLYQKISNRENLFSLSKNEH